MFDDFSLRTYKDLPALRQVRLPYVLVFINYHMLSHGLFSLSLVFFCIVWCILPRYFWYRFLVHASTSLTWSCLVDGEIEIHCASLLGIRNLDQLHKSFQQMKIFCCRRLRYLLLWVLVYWKLRRLAGQPAEAKASSVARVGPRLGGLK